VSEGRRKSAHRADVSLKKLDTKETNIFWVPEGSALKRILDAVAKTAQGKRLIQNVDHNALATDLSDAWSKWLLWSALDSRGGAKRRARLFRALKISANEFKKCLLDKTGDFYLSREIIFAAFADENSFGSFQASLDRIIAVASQKMNEDQAWFRLNRSLKEWFAGEILGKVFRRNFGTEPSPGPVRDADGRQQRADTPSIRFVVQVMKEMGMGGGPDLVSRAFKDVKAGRPGRRTQ
jgi:hypothetical protein